MRGVLVAAFLVLAVMIAIKDGRFLHEAGLTGGCRAVAPPAGQKGNWEACDPGKLQGAPDLSRQGCKSITFVGKTEYWRCPAGIEGGPGS
jgi:hypothetical protein